MELYCPFCEEDLTNNNIILKREKIEEIRLLTEYLEENSEDLEMDTMESEEVEDTYICEHCKHDITSYILVEKDLCAAF